MKLATVVFSVLAALAGAGVVPAENAEPGISLQQDGPSMLFATSGSMDVPPGKFVSLAKCFKKHKGYKVDFSKEKQGIVAVTKLDKTCCNQAKDLWTKYKKDMSKWGKPVFLNPCTGFTVSGVSQKNIENVKKILKRIEDMEDDEDE